MCALNEVKGMNLNMKSRLNIIRKGVRCFCIQDNKCVCIKTNESSFKPGFFDIPGGKIEKNETIEEAVIREYKEETGTDILNPVYRGIINVVFPKGTYQYHTFISDSFKGTLVETEEATPFLLDINKILSSEKRFACTVMLEPSFLKVLLDKSKSFELTVYTNEQEIINGISFTIKEL